MCHLSGPTTLLLIANVLRFPPHHPKGEGRFFARLEHIFQRVEVPKPCLHKNIGAENCSIHALWRRRDEFFRSPEWHAPNHINPNHANFVRDMPRQKEWRNLHTSLKDMRAVSEEAKSVLAGMCIDRGNHQTSRGWILSTRPRRNQRILHRDKRRRVHSLLQLRAPNTLKGRVPNSSNSKTTMNQLILHHAKRRKTSLGKAVVLSNSTIQKQECITSEEVNLASLETATMSETLHRPSVTQLHVQFPPSTGDPSSDSLQSRAPCTVLLGFKRRSVRRRSHTFFIERRRMMLRLLHNSHSQ